MRKKLLLTTMFLLACFGIAKAETVQIGSLESYNYGVPLVTNWCCCFSQQIYTAAEIGKTGTITSIAFKIGVSAEKNRNIDVYLVKTSKSTFSSESDFVSVTESDKVFSGKVSFTGEAWTTIAFSKNFSYDGSANLCVVVNDKTGTIETNGRFFCTLAAENQAITRYTNDDFFNPASPGSLGSSTARLLNFKNQIQLTFGAGGGGTGTGEVVHVGSGTETDDVGLPMSTIWKYSITQQIYTIAEVGHTGTINSIAFKTTSASDNVEKTRTIDLYLSKTNKSSFSGASDGIAVTESNKVFSGTVTFTEGDWTTIAFATPFEYDGTANLCVTMNDKTGGFSDYGPHWLVYSGENQAIRLYNDVKGAFNPSSPDSWVANSEYNNLYNKKNQLQLTFTGGGGGSETPIHSVYINGYEPPVAGENSQNHLNVTIPSGANYSIYYGDGEEPRWYNDDSSMYFSGTFVAGTCYSLGLSVKANDGYYFADDCIFYLNGGTELVDGVNTRTDGNDNHWATIWSVTKAATGGGGGSESGVVEIGTGDVTNNYLPTNTYYKYSLSQQIYTKGEVGAARNLTSISFYNTGEERTRNIDLYLVLTGKSRFDSDEDWISFTEEEKVYSGEVTFTADNWTTITFSKPFAYDGVSNLAVVVDDNTGAYNLSVPFRVCGCTSTQSIYVYSDEINYVPADVSTYKGTLQNPYVKNQIKLNGELLPGAPLLISSYLPTTSFYNYSLTQQIYTKDELGEAKDLTSVSFLNAGSEKKRKLSIYMVHTTKETFEITNTENDTSNDWVSFTEADKVFDGEVTFISGDWIAIKFNKAFSYNGTDNVVLIVDDNTGTYSSGLACGVFSATKQTLAVRSDDNDFTAENMSTYYSIKWTSKNAIKFNEEGLDIKPTSIAVSNVEWNSAVVTWESDGSKWNLQYKKSSAEEWNEISGLTSKSYKLESLSENTDYDVRVQADNGSGNLSEWIKTTFTTPERYSRPTDLTVSHITPYTARLSWTDNCGASSWDIYLTDGVNERYLHSKNTYCNLYDLEEGTEYRVKVRSVIDDGAGEYSNWTDFEIFSTLERNPVPYDIAVEPASTSATISWKGTSESYEVKYRKAGTAGTLYDFDDGTFQDWTTIDADGDGYTWVLGSAIGGVYLSEGASVEGMGYNGTSDFMTSGSYSNITNSALTPDNYLVSPLVELGGSISFYVCGLDSNYPNEHFGVAVSTTSNTDPAAFTLLDEWTLNGDGTGSKSTRRKSQSTWGKFYVDLSAYAGKQGYVAIRHFNCTDQFVLDLDDILITSPGEEEPWSSVETTANQVTITGLTSSTDYEYKVVGKMDYCDDASSPFGTFTTMENNPVPYDIAIDAGSTSATLSWKGNGDQYEVLYRPAGGEALTFEDFESSESLPADWQSVDADGDGYKWYTLPEAKVVLQTDQEVNFYTHSGNGIVTSASYINNIGSTSIGALTPDNWLITPQVTLGNRVSAWLRGQDANYAEEHFAFYVSTTGTDPSNFTQVSDEYVATDEYKEYSADLSAYAGQKGYVAVRHYNITDMYWLDLDDFGIYSVEWQSVSTSDTEVTLGGLDPYKTYEFMIKGIKSGEPEANSGVSSFTTNGNATDIVFSNTFTTDIEVVAANGVYANVTISDRTLKKNGKWQTLCLPFDVDIENSPLAGGDARTVESVTFKNSNIILNCQTPVTKLKAGVPYIIRWNEGSDITDPVFYGVTVHNVGNSIVLMNGEVIFTGLYYRYAFSSSTDEYRVMEDGNPLLAPCDNGTIINAFDSYLYIGGNTYQITEACVLNTGEEDELITGVSSLGETEEGAAIYNLAGMRLSKKQKGINIINGKKVLVK